MIVAALALTVALGGTAIAADPAAKINKAKVKTIAKKQINKLAPGLDVANAKTADTADTATTAENTFGVSADNSGNITDSTIQGATLQKAANTFTWTFPRDVVACVPVVSGIFSDEFVALQSGTANPNDVIVTAFGATGDHNLIVTCP